MGPIGRLRRSSFPALRKEPLLALAGVLLAAVVGVLVWSYVVGPSPPERVPRVEVDLTAAPESAPTLESAAEEPPPPAAETAPATPAADSALAPAWQRFARPFPAGEARPRIAVVVTGLGLAAAITGRAIQELPGEITLSFSPYGQQLGAQVAAARAAGHEVMLDLPMEPVSYPRDDPGPQALLTSLAPEENRSRLDWVLGRAEGYVGVVNWMGSRFLASGAHLRPVLEELKARGLMFLDGRDSSESLGAPLAQELGLPSAVNDRFLDVEPSRVAIDGRLQQIERMALTRGYALAVAQGLPVTLERLSAWAATLGERGFALAPVSALAQGESQP